MALNPYTTNNGIYNKTTKKIQIVDNITGEVLVENMSEIIEDHKATIQLSVGANNPMDAILKECSIDCIFHLVKATNIIELNENEEFKNFQIP